MLGSVAPQDPLAGERRGLVNIVLVAPQLGFQGGLERHVAVPKSVTDRVPKSVSELIDELGSKLTGERDKPDR